MEFTLHVWRQKNSKDKGHFETYKATEISSDMSFIEMIDSVNQKLAESNKEPIAYDADCLEGICGACSMVINGVPHGPESGTTTCQLHMRKFTDGEHITIEPWRARAFPPIKDLVVDRSAFDRIIQVGGFVSVNTGNAQDANSLLIAKPAADRAMDAAECIGCGACVAGCSNGSAMLFVGAKISHLANLPQGQPERMRRALKMVQQMDAEGFGNCTNQYECEAVCPKEISVRVISDMNRDYIKASACSEE